MGRKLTTVILMVVFMVFVSSSLSWSYHRPPLDTGHSRTNPDPPYPPDPPDPPDDDPCKNKDKPGTDSKGSPVRLAVGNLVLTFVDATISGPGPSLDIVRSYNSQEHYNGPFGYGWVTEHTMQLVEYTDGLDDYVLIRLPDGRRAEFIKNSDGSYTGLDVLAYDQLGKNPDGSFILNSGCSACSRASTPEIKFNTDGFPAYISDLAGNTLSFSYNTAGLLTKVSNAAGKALSYSYGSNQKVSAIGLPNGDRYQYQYDDEQNLIGVTDPGGNTTFFVYDEAHNLISIIDPNGRTRFQATYGDTDRVSSYSVAAETYSYSYDPGNNKTSKTDSDNNTWTYYYNADELITKIVYPDGSSTVIAFDDKNNPTQVTDANGHVWTYTYDQKGNLLSKTDPLGNTWSWTYNAQNLKISETDPLNATETFTYDFSGNRVGFTDKNGSSWTYTYNSFGQPTGKTDPLGNSWSYEYDQDGNLVREIDPLGHVTSYSYDQLGRKLSQTDPRGNTTLFGYNSAGQLILIRDALGHDTTFAYDAAGNKVSKTDALGHTTRFQYDSHGRMVKTIGALGNVTTYSYNAKGRKITETDPLGNRMTWTYNARGWLVSEKDASGNATTYQYDNLGQVTAVTDARGQQTSFTYDAAGRRTQITDAVGNTQKFVLDPLGRVTQIIDGKNNTLYRTYDSLGKIVAIIDQEGTQSNFVYDALGNVLQKTISANGTAGLTTGYTYDALSRQISVIQPNGDTTSYTFDPNGNRKTITGPDGSTVTFDYDVLNRLVRSYDSLGVLKQMSYDAVGNLITETDALSDTTRYTYDALNRKTQILYSNGSKMSSAYDQAGHMLTMVNRRGNTISFTRDALGRVISINDGHRNGTVTYDEVGNRMKLTDYKGQVIQFAYDGLNRKTKVIHPDGSTDLFTYDANNNLIKKVIGGNATLTYTYDKRNRLTLISAGNGTQHSYAYNFLGLMTNATSGNHTLGFVYDANARLIQEVQPAGTVQYAYDSSNGTKTITYPGGRIVTEDYDLRKRLKTVSNGSGTSLFSNQFNSTTQELTGRSFANGITAQYAHDSEGLSSLGYTRGSNALASYEYTRDKTGNVVQAKDLLNAAKTKNYSYDDLGRLIKVALGETSPEITDFSLDKNGNRINKKVDSQVTDYSVNVLNQYTKVDGVDYAYDQAGNLKEDEEHQYEYNTLNQLTKAIDKTSQTVLSSYSYDALGRRYSKLTSGVLTEYIYSSERQILEEYKDQVLFRSYVYSGPLPNQVFSMRIHTGSDAGTYTYLKDRMGSIIAVTDSNGAVVERYQYGPYGKVYQPDGSLLASSSVGNPFFYVGQMLDMDSGLYYFHARYYRADIGRFLSRDPLGYSRAGFNLYAYANSNPMAFVDPYGLEAAKCEEVASLELDISDEFADILSNLDFLATIDIDSESSLKFVAEECKGRCCVHKTGNWKNGSWYKFTASGSAKISYKQLIPGAGFEIPGTDIGGGIYAEIGIQITASGVLSKSWDKECNLQPYGEACLSLDEGYVQLSLEAQAYIVEAGLYSKLSVSAEVCARTSGVIKGKFCIAGKIWAEGKVDIWLTTIEEDFDIWVSDKDGLCTYLSKKIL